MKKSLILGAVAAAVLAGGVTLAVAAGETTSINYNVKGKFTPKKFKPAKLTFGVSVAPGVGSTEIQPLKRANMKFPSSGTMIFSPKKGLPACKASVTALSVSPEAAYQECGTSVIGNGEATFQLGQKVGTSFFRKGTVVVFYGGKVGKNHKIVFSAWSGDTRAGVYAFGILKPNGTMDIAMPVLTADSAVTLLQIAIPGEEISGEFANGTPYSLRKGLDPSFVRVKCRQNAKLTFSTKFELGDRNEDTGGNIGPTTFSNAKSSSKCGK